MRKASDLMIHISTESVLKVILLLLMVWAIYLLRDLVLIVLTAIVIASAIEPAVRWFGKYKIPRIAAVVFVYLTVVVFFLGIFYFFVPSVLGEATSFLSSLPMYLESFNAGGADGVISPGNIANYISLQELIEQLHSALSNLSTSLLSTIATVFGGVLSFGLIIVFSFYFAVQEKNVDDFLQIVTPTKHQAYVLGLWHRSQEKIGRWMQGQLILALIVGILVYLGLTVLGVRFALLLAIIAAVFELIPVFGPILSGIPAVLIAFTNGVGFAGVGFSAAGIVAALYVLIQQFENHLLYPLVVTKVVGVPPILVILSLLIGAELAGFLGVILSVPAAAVVQELVHDWERRKLREAEHTEE